MRRVHIDLRSIFDIYYSREIEPAVSIYLTETIFISFEGNSFQEHAVYLTSFRMNFCGKGVVIYYGAWCLEEKWEEFEILKENLTWSEIFCHNLKRPVSNRPSARRPTDQCVPLRICCICELPAIIQYKSRGPTGL